VLGRSCFTADTSYWWRVVVLIAPDGTLGSQFPFACATEGGVYVVSICRVPAAAPTTMSPQAAGGGQMHLERGYSRLVERSRFPYARNEKRINKDTHCSTPALSCIMPPSSSALIPIQPSLIYPNLPSRRPTHPHPSRDHLGRDSHTALSPTHRKRRNKDAPSLHTAPSTHAA
jgi:hypothetical protein